MKLKPERFSPAPPVGTGPPHPSGFSQAVYDEEIRELLFLLKIGICFLAGFTGMAVAVILL